MENQTIELVGIPCFGDQAVEFHLAKSNFIYGPNGSGKSSIARKLGEQNLGEPERSISVELFNQQYIQDFINPDAEIPGVFTVRAGSPEIQERLKQLEGGDGEDGEIAKADNQLRNFKGSYEKQEKLVKDATQSFEEDIWELKKSLPGILQKHAFKGFRNNKKRFSEEAARRSETLLEEKYETEVETEKALAAKLSSLNSAEASAKVDLVSEIPAIPEISEPVVKLLAKPLSEDSSNRLSALIGSIENSEWVREGIDHLDHSNGLCPFCQKEIEEVLAEEIRSLFDSEYENAKALVQLLQQNFDGYIRDLDSYIERLKEIEIADTAQFEHVLLLLKTETEKIIRNLELKSADMSRIVVLGSVPSVAAAREELKGLNSQIAQHNLDIENKEEALIKISDSIWKTFLSRKDVAAAFIGYKSRIENPNKALSKLQLKIDNCGKLLNDLRDEYEDCKSQLTSAIDVRDEINENLKGLGFRSFHLSLIDGDSKYRIVRSDGQYASFLSEGEKTLISFLYFYQRIKDEITDSGTPKKIWVVLDDPVSSLDSQSLTVISLLCRNLARKSEEPGNNLDKFLLLTHNAYFYEESIYEGSRRKDPNPERRLYSIIRKNVDGTSKIETTPENQIVSTYELLWQDIREAKTKNIVSASVQNAMRRILEVYFKFIGDVESNVIDKLDIEFQLPAKSLLSWINDGSHKIRWDLDSAQTNLESAVHFRVFEEIFKVADQIGHYNMMMHNEV